MGVDTKFSALFEMASAVINKKSIINFIPIPENLINRYQFYTRSDNSKIYQQIPDLKNHTLEDSLIHFFMIDPLFKNGYIISFAEGEEYVMGIRKSNYISNSLAKNILYLDRDGVLNKDTGYPNLNSLSFDPKMLEKLREFIDFNNIDAVCVVSNQSGIARGLLSLEEAIDVMLEVIDFSKKMEFI